jgi:CDP-paratose 2-epimerase
MAKQFLITGGAGFIGSNYVARLVERGESVTVYDNLSRTGAQRNLDWLRQTYGDDSFRLIPQDIRNRDEMRQAAAGADVIVHLAAQVAVTTSVTDPRQDFDINALGTFNVLEAARASGRDPVVLYASTNKVYGGMEEVGVVEEGTRYRYADLPMGVPETQPLDFHSPVWLFERRWATSTCEITTVFTACRPSSCARAASMGRASLGLKTRAGWPGL